MFIAYLGAHLHCHKAGTGGIHFILKGLTPENNKYKPPVFETGVD